MNNEQLNKFRQIVFDYVGEVELKPLLEENEWVSDLYDRGLLTHEDFYNMVCDIQLGVKQDEVVVCRVIHPDAPILRHSIIEVEAGVYVFDIYGDYYDKSWCEDPLEECKTVAMDDLKSTYNGVSCTESYGEYSERITFSCK